MELQRPDHHADLHRRKSPATSGGRGDPAAGGCRYRQAIQGAFREVDDSSPTSPDAGAAAAQARQVQALQKYVELSQLRFDNGYTSYLEVLDANARCSTSS